MRKIGRVQEVQKTSLIADHITVPPGPLLFSPSRRYAAIIEAKQYPFSGIAFHPEKVVYEWTPAIHIPHSKEAVDAAYAIGQAFVEGARMNYHGGASIVEEGG